MAALALGRRLALLAGAVLLAAACAAPAPPASPTPLPPPPTATGVFLTPSPPPATAAPTPAAEQARLVRVIDGDTIEVDLGAAQERVRYIGIDAPELAGPGAPQPFAEEARAYNARLVGGGALVLERDVSDRDRYGRLLRYVYADGTLVNRALVAAGLARAAAYPPDTRLQASLEAAQAEARRAGLGLWGGLTPAPSVSAAAPSATPAPPPATPPAEASPPPSLTAGPGGATAAGAAASPTPTPQTGSSPPPGCLIKGNISASGERIYHVPGGRFYDRTVIDVARGERWFCSEAEAQAAGWRRSQQ